MPMTLPNWVVTSVQANDDYTLDLAFHDGKNGRFDMKPYLGSQAFSPLKDIGLFKMAHLECGTVVWNDFIDIAPERLWSDCVPL